MHADEKANAHSALKTSAKFILQGPASARCCSVAKRQQAPSLPRRRLGCHTAKLMLALTHADENNKSHKVQFLHWAEFARFHARRKRNAIRIRNSTESRIDLLAVDVEFLAAQLHLRHGTRGCGRSVHAASGKNVAPNSTKAAAAGGGGGGGGGCGRKPRNSARVTTRRISGFKF